VPSGQPPADGKIASAGNAAAAVLDEQTSMRWTKHSVGSGQVVNITWSSDRPELVRRWNYFITKEGWDPDSPLTRDQFEAQPFYQETLNAQPYWDARDGLTPRTPTVHEVRLPERRGYHVILAVCEIADTGKASCQVIDVDFT
jgi:chitin-binding protein